MALFVVRFQWMELEHPTGDLFMCTGKQYVYCTVLSSQEGARNRSLHVLFSCYGEG